MSCWLGTSWVSFNLLFSELFLFSGRPIILDNYYSGIIVSGLITIHCVSQVVSPAVMVEVESSGLVVRKGSDIVVLTCEVYGYPQNSSLPKWSSPGRDLKTGRFNTTLSNTGLLTDGSVSSTEKVVVSQLTIYCASETDEGNYTCSVDGKSASFYVELGKLNTLIHVGVLFYNACYRWWFGEEIRHKW